MCFGVLEDHGTVGLLARGAEEIECFEEAPDARKMFLVSSFNGEDWHGPEGTVWRRRLAVLVTP